MVLIHVAIIFKYRFPTTEGLRHPDFSKTGLWFYLLSVFLYQFACLAIPFFSRKIRYLSLFLIAQPAIVIPTLVALQWRWHPSFAIPIMIFLIWFVVMFWRLLIKPEEVANLLQVGRPLVDFLLLGSVGLALFFKWNGEATIFNSYTLRTLLLLCPGYFIAGSLVAWFRTK